MSSGGGGDASCASANSRVIASSVSGATTVGILPRITDATGDSLVIVSEILKKPLRGDTGALSHRREFGPHYIFGDPSHPGRGVKAAIGTGHHTPRVADGARDVFEPVGNDLRMLNKAGQIVDDPGGDDLIGGKWKFLQYAIFVLMPGIGKGQHKPANIGPLEDRQYVAKRDIAIMRPLVIAPANVETHPVAGHIDDCLVDCRDDPLDKAEKLADRAIVVGQMPLKCEIRAI